MLKQKIGIIGYGNMGKAIVEGLLSKQIVPAEHLIVSDSTMPVSDQSIVCTTNNKELVQNADIIILAVKPQIMQTVLTEIKESVPKSQLIISIAAGITINNIQKTLGDNQPIVRTMPNLCARIGESMTAWTKTKTVSQDQEASTKEILQAIGKEVQVSDESMINSFTAIAGSGPAYVFYLAELLEKAALQFGFSQEDAQTIVDQTLKGSIEMLLQSADSPEVLRQQVTSKGGTTEAAFHIFQENDLKEVFSKAMEAAKKRAEELAI